MAGRKPQTIEELKRREAYARELQRAYKNFKSSDASDHSLEHPSGHPDASMQERTAILMNTPTTPSSSSDDVWAQYRLKEPVEPEYRTTYELCEWHHQMIAHIAIDKQCNKSRVLQAIIDGAPVDTEKYRHIPRNTKLIRRGYTLLKRQYIDLVKRGLEGDTNASAILREILDQKLH